MFHNECKYASRGTGGETETRTPDCIWHSVEEGQIERRASLRLAVKGYGSVSPSPLSAPARTFPELIPETANTPLLHARILESEMMPRAEKTALSR